MRPRRRARTIAGMTSTIRLQVTLELRQGTDPLSGRVIDEGGRNRDFVGWIGLARALEEALATPDVPTKEDLR